MITAPDDAQVQIDFSGAPPDAVVSSVTVYYEIEHTCIDDLQVEVWTRNDLDLRITHRLKDPCEIGGGCENCNPDYLHETVDNIDTFDGLSPNQAWYLTAQDCWPGDVGEIRMFEIWVQYE